jgi:hypothetical protein
MLAAGREVGEFKTHPVEPFKGILHAAVKTDLKANSQIPRWATARFSEAWNIN